jgi:hypothetical protein
MRPSRGLLQDTIVLIGGEFCTEPLVFGAGDNFIVRSISLSAWAALKKHMIVVALPRPHHNNFSPN